MLLKELQCISEYFSRVDPGRDGRPARRVVAGALDESVITGRLNRLKDATAILAYHEVFGLLGLFDPAIEAMATFGRAAPGDVDRDLVALRKLSQRIRFLVGSRCRVSSASSGSSGMLSL